MHRRRQGGRQRERGAIAVLAALLVMVLGGFLALTLDIGHKFSAKAQLEGAGDAAALAGTRSLNGTASGLSAARQLAGTFATSHFLDSSSIAINPATDVILGFWDSSRRTFSSSGSITVGDADVVLSAGSTPQYFNAVKVLTAADGGAGHNSSLNVFFGVFVGWSGGLISKSSVVVAGGGPCDESRNVLPLVAPSCAIADGNGSTLCNQRVTLSFNWGGNQDVGFADLTPPSGVVEEGEVRDQLQDARGNAPEIDAFDPIAITNGAGYDSTTINVLRGFVCGSDPAGCPTYVLPIVNVGVNCSANMATPRAKPVGFTQVVVTDVTWSGPTRTIEVYIACDRAPSQHRGGCALFGWPSIFPPSLVK